MFTFGNATFACGFAALANGRLRRLVTVRQKLEDARWRRSHTHCWRWRRGLAPSRQTEPQLEPATFAGIILPEPGEFLLLCSLQLWQQLQRCRQTRARVQVFRHFTSILQKQFAANDTFLREAKGYNQALALRNARQVSYIIALSDWMQSLMHSMSG